MLVGVTGWLLVLALVLLIGVVPAWAPVKPKVLIDSISLRSGRVGDLVRIYSYDKGAELSGVPLAEGFILEASKEICTGSSGHANGFDEISSQWKTVKNLNRHGKSRLQQFPSIQRLIEFHGSGWKGAPMFDLSPSFHDSRSVAYILGVNYDTYDFPGVQFTSQPDTLNRNAPTQRFLGEAISVIGGLGRINNCLALRLNLLERVVHGCELAYHGVFLQSSDMGVVSGGTEGEESGSKKEPLNRNRAALEFLIGYPIGGSLVGKGVQRIGNLSEAIFWPWVALFVFGGLLLGWSTFGMLLWW